MTESEQDEFERQLRRTTPAKLPADFAARLRAAKPARRAAAESGTLAGAVADNFRRHWRSLRWLIPASAMLLAAMLAWHGSAPEPGRLPADAEPWPVLQADDVQIDQRLVSSFDAVAQLPGGEPVRFRCENWLDQFSMSDKARGVVVQNRRPRFEVTPVGYETY